MKVNYEIKHILLRAFAPSLRLCGFRIHHELSYEE